MPGSAALGFDPAAAIAEIQAAQLQIAEAADAILFATEISLASLSAHRAGDLQALSEVERALCAILGACAFQDLSGQRLSKVERWLKGDSTPSGDPLAHGPAPRGEGLDQDAADSLFAACPPPAASPPSTMSR